MAHPLVSINAFMQCCRCRSHMQVVGFRRVFAHTAPIFFQRGIARLETREISSLSCEEAPGHSIVVSVFDVPYSPAMVEARTAMISDAMFVCMLLMLFTRHSHVDVIPLLLPYWPARVRAHGPRLHFLTDLCLSEYANMLDSH